MRRKVDVNQLMLIAQDCIQKRQYNNAIKILNQVTELQSKKDEAYRLIADCFDQLGQREQAEKYYKIGIDCNPVSTICYANYGLMLYNMGRKDQAEKLYELCMEINPKDPTVLNNYMILLYEIGKIQRAEEVMKQCRAVDPKNVNCQVYLNKISESRLKSKRNMKIHNARPNTTQQQLIDLLIERNTKLDQKQIIIQNLRRQLQKKDNELKQLRNEINLKKKLRQEQQNSRLCKICLNKTAMYVNKKCGHLSACKGCLGIVGKNCPLCRQSGSFIRVYSSMIRQEYY